VAARRAAPAPSRRCRRCPPPPPPPRRRRRRCHCRHCRCRPPHAPLHPSAWTGPTAGGGRRSHSHTPHRPSRPASPRRRHPPHTVPVSAARVGIRGRPPPRRRHRPHTRPRRPPRSRSAAHHGPVRPPPWPPRASAGGRPSHPPWPRGRWRAACVVGAPQRRSGGKKPKQEEAQAPPSTASLPHKPSRPLRCRRGAQWSLPGDEAPPPSRVCTDGPSMCVAHHRVPGRRRATVTAAVRGAPRRFDCRTCRNSPCVHSGAGSRGPPSLPPPPAGPLEQVPVWGRAVTPLGCPTLQVWPQPRKLPTWGVSAANGSQDLCGDAHVHAAALAAGR